MAIGVPPGDGRPPVAPRWLGHGGVPDHEVAFGVIFVAIYAFLILGGLYFFR
jgi:hypothetical protein